MFRRDEKTGKIVYLILHYHFKGDYWDFSRGKMEKGEKEEETARREIKEETGLTDLKFIDGFREVTHWFYRWKGQNVYKEAVYFLAEAPTGEVKISHEHIDFTWADFEETMKVLTFNNTKNIMIKAHEFVQSNLQQQTDSVKD